MKQLTGVYIVIELFVTHFYLNSSMYEQRKMIDQRKPKKR